MKYTVLHSIFPERTQRCSVDVLTPSRLAASEDFRSRDWLVVMDVLLLEAATHIENAGCAVVIKSVGLEGLVRLPCGRPSTDQILSDPVFVRVAGKGGLPCRIHAGVKCFGFPEGHPSTL